MKPPMFHVGQNVVAIHTQFAWEIADYESAPKKDRIYTISEVAFVKDKYAKWWQPWKKACMLRLSGVRSRWDAYGFAPVELLSNESLAELLSETLDPVTA
jgi:hypothetical protein